MSWYITLLFCGLFLIGLEIFLPGGILGIFGAVALVAAAIVGFTIFPLWLGWISLLAILMLAVLAVFIWMKYLPASPIGKALSLSQNLDDAEKVDSQWEMGMTGTALCDLRPAGKASINNQRADVIAQNGSFVSKGSEIKVVRISGNHVYVKEIER
jgi:membrane-bound serine protease (ClpP class)